MTYAEYIRMAKACTNWDDANMIVKAAEDDEKISDRQYYDIRHIAINAAYE